MITAKEVKINERPTVCYTDGRSNHNTYGGTVMAGKNSSNTTGRKQRRKHKSPEHHGMVGTREYRAWSDMLTRCRNPNFIKWEYYGGKGVAVCQEWQDSFAAFFAHMGKCPPNHSLDRIDSTKNYGPGNCRWITQSQQMRNTQRTRMITYKGKTQCMSDWAIELNVSLPLLQHRLDRGWKLERAMTHPAGLRGRLLTLNGKTQNIEAWTKELGFKKGLIVSRLKKGWDIERTLTSPVRKKNANGNDHTIR